MSHTPGPWIVANFGHGLIMVETDDVKDHEDQFSVDGRSHTTICRDVRSGNAQLIAAAPDLLATAQAMLAALTPRQVADCGVDEEFQMLRAAVEKATK